MSMMTGQKQNGCPDMDATPPACQVLMGDGDGRGDSKSSNGAINLASRCSSRAGQLSIRYAYGPPHPQTPSLKIGAANPESMEAPTATDMLGTRVQHLRISKFIGMPSRRRRNCQSQKLERVQCTYPVTPAMTSRSRNDTASWRKHARRLLLLFECWPRRRRSSSSSSKQAVTRTVTEV